MLAPCAHLKVCLLWVSIEPTGILPLAVNGVADGQRKQHGPYQAVRSDRELAMTIQTQINQSAIKSAEKQISGDQALEMGISAPFELVNGSIVYMDHAGDEHGIQEAEIAWHLMNFNRQHKTGWVLTGEVGVYTRRNPDTVRAADVIFISRQRLPVPSGKALKVAPELVVEIVPPTDRWRDVRDKIEEYFAIGVERVWIVEPETKTVLVYRTPVDLIKLTQDDTLRGEGVLDGFVLPLAEFFAVL